MPTYQYVCTECGTPLEAVQSFTDAALIECPTCGGRLRKVFSAVGVVFKGSGFYRNDSRSEKKPAAASAKSTDSKPSTDGKASSDAKTSSDNSSGASSSKDSSGSGSSTSSSVSSGSGSSAGSSSGSSGSTKTTAPKT